MSNRGTKTSPSKQPILGVEPEDADEVTLAFFAKAEKRFQTLQNVYKIFGHQPEYGHAFTDLMLAISKDGVLSWRMKELLIVKTVLECKSQYCVPQHEMVAAALGLSSMKLAALKDRKYSASSEFSGKERALLDYVMQITENAGDVSPALWERLSLHCSEAEIVDAAFVTTTFISVSKFAKALDLEIDAENTETEWIDV